MANPETPTSTKARGGGKLGRRALLTTAGLGVCAVGAGAVVAKGGDIANYEMDRLLQNELDALEGVGLDDAIAAAELTQKAVQIIVLPVARLASTLGSGLLTLWIDALSRAQQGLSIINIHIDALANLQSMLQSWQSGVNDLPVALDQMTTADINSATTYLKALKAKTEAANKPLF